IGCPQLLLDSESLLVIVDQWLIGYELLCNEKQFLSPKTNIIHTKLHELNNENNLDNYWNSNLENVSNVDLTFATKEKDIIVGSPHGKESFTLGNDVKALLHDFATEHNLNKEIILESAWLFILSRFACQSEVFYKTTLNTRPHLSELNEKGPIG